MIMDNLRSAGIDTDAMWGFSHTKGWLDIWIQITFDIKSLLILFLYI